MVGRRLRFAAVLVVVVLALTGFQTSTGGKSGGRGKSKSGSSRSSGGGGGGGGCSSSKKSNGGYHDYDNDNDDDYDSSSSGSSGSYTGEPTPTPTSTSLIDVVISECVDAKQRRRKGKKTRTSAGDTSATVRLTSRYSVRHTYRVTVNFAGVSGSSVDSGQAEVVVEPGATASVEVGMKNPKSVSRVKKCVLGQVELRD